MLLCTVQYSTGKVGSAQRILVQIGHTLVVRYTICMYKPQSRAVHYQQAIVLVCTWILAKLGAYTVVEIGFLRHAAQKVLCMIIFTASARDGILFTGNGEN